MTRTRRALFLTTAIASSLFALGFLVFATRAMNHAGEQGGGADGIVVLTGGEQRIAEGARLLKQGRSARMLISGVNRRTGRDDLVRITGLTAAQFDCCVDLGYDALDTYGNAEETRAWATSKGFRSLIVVTASYHMPRSLTELSLALPGTLLIPHPVVPKAFPDSGWWLSPMVAKALVAEYLKFLPAAARLAVARVFGPGGRGTLAGPPDARRAGVDGKQ
jgi:uncharacterized SAM-binding protein YcdF (DUF218 family)